MTNRIAFVALSAAAALSLAGCGVAMEGDEGTLEQAATANLALGRPVTASSVEAAGLEASRAVDGSASTRWSSAYSDPQWIRVDLGAEYKLDRVRLVWETAYARAFAVQISKDGVTYTNLYSTTSNSSRTNDLTALAAASGRYLRIQGTRRATSWGYSLWEIEAFGTAVSATPSGNLARGRPATSSTVEGAGLEAARAVDGSGTTRWSSAYADPQWLQVDLGASYSLNRVRIAWETAYARAYKVQISSDGVTFADLYSTTSNAGLVNELSGLPATAGRYLRIAGTQRATSWGYSIWELEAYGTPASTTTPPPPAQPGVLTVSGVSLGASSITAGQSLTATVTFTNSTSSAITLARGLITARPPGATHAGGPAYDFAPVSSAVTVQPGASHRLQASNTFASSVATGAWEIYGTYQDAAGAWHDGVSATFTVNAPVTQPPTTRRFPVIGYFPTWSGSVSAIPYQHLTHINYSFVLPTASGGLTSIDLNRLRSLVDTAHARGVKVNIAIGGWNDGNDSAFEALAGNATARANFVNNVAQFVTANNLDGVDIDWEFPDPGTSGTNFSYLMRDLYARLHPMGKELSAALGPTYYANAIPTSSWANMDYVNIMAYDCVDCGGLNSPYWYAENLLNVYLGRGVPQSKAILGLPFYGSNGTTSDTIQKTKLAMAKAGGVMIWEVSNGVTPTLLQAISDTLAGKY